MLNIYFSEFVALTSVIVNSIQEDSYGVLQKDLKAITSALTRLSMGIDAYTRASGVCDKRFDILFILGKILVAVNFGYGNEHLRARLRTRSWINRNPGCFWAPYSVCLLLFSFIKIQVKT